LAEDGDDVGSVGSTHKFKGALDVFDKLVLAVGDGLGVQIDLVGDDHARNVGAVVAQFLVPVLEILIGDLARGVEDQDANVRAIVIRRVQLIERLLSRSVPNVYSYVCVFS
jgi:hypothetical protein